MAYQLTMAKPLVRLDIDKLERGLAQLLDSKGWTTDAQFNAGVDAMTSAQTDAAFKAFLKAIVRVG